MPTQQENNSEKRSITPEEFEQLKKSIIAMHNPNLVPAFNTGWEELNGEQIHEIDKIYQDIHDSDYAKKALLLHRKIYQYPLYNK